MSKKKTTPYAQRKVKQDAPNKKLIIWVSSILGAIVIGMSVLLIVNS
ncbi:hypothetical protein WMW72_00160 [Paenibacillus filicis]|uniref:DUF4044 domain-containing protein n=1 Tax=Paenibacillus filicis TaxID=669464 RepID=A0ABU9DBV1_9BACL